MRRTESRYRRLTQYPISTMMLPQVLAMVMVLVAIQPAGVGAVAPAENMACGPGANPFINNNGGALNMCAGRGQMVQVQVN